MHARKATLMPQGAHWIDQFVQYVFPPTPYRAMGEPLQIEAVYLVATTLSRDGIAVAKFTTSRKFHNAAPFSELCTCVCRYTQHLQLVSAELCSALDYRAEHTPVVHDVSDIMQAHEHAIAVALYRTPPLHPRPLSRNAVKSTLLCDSPLCRDGIVVIKFTKASQYRAIV